MSSKKMLFKALQWKTNHRQEKGTLDYYSVSGFLSIRNQVFLRWEGDYPFTCTRRSKRSKGFALLFILCRAYTKWQRCGWMKWMLHSRRWCKNLQQYRIVILMFMLWIHKINTRIIKHEMKVEFVSSVLSRTLEWSYDFHRSCVSSAKFHIRSSMGERDSGLKTNIHWHF